MSFASLSSRRLVLCLIAAQMSLVLGCGGARDPLSKIKKDPTGVVKGVVQIDGSPKPGVRVYAFKEDNQQGGLVDPTNNMANNMTTSGEGGAFAFTTYEARDGLPEGNYALAFFWNGEQLSMEISSDNVRTTKEAAAFNKKYGNPAKSEFKFTAKKGTPVDLGVLDLKTK